MHATTDSDRRSHARCRRGTAPRASRRRAGVYEFYWSIGGDLRCDTSGWTDRLVLPFMRLD